MIAEVDEAMSGILDFGELLQVIEVEWSGRVEWEGGWVVVHAIHMYSLPPQVQKLRAAAFGT